MNQSLLEKAKEALEHIELMEEQGWLPAMSIAQQLRWCVAFASGAPKDARPGSFSMGLIATKELEMWESQLQLGRLISDIQM